MAAARHNSTSLGKRLSLIILVDDSHAIRGSFFMFVESGDISTNKEFTVP